MNCARVAWRVLCPALVLVTWANAARAAEPPADGPLAKLAWLAGGTWVADLKGQDGRATRVECRFDWAEHGKALKYVIHFKAEGGPVPQYEGIYYYHPAKKHIAMLQVDRAGNVTESVVTAEGDTLAQENQTTTADGTTRPQRVKVTREGPDAFSFKAMVQRDGQWVEAVAFTYKRERRGEPKER